MKKFKVLAAILIFFSITFLIFKIDPSKDVVGNIKNIFHPKIVFQYKKIYLKYLHDFKSKINIKKDRDEKILSSKGREFNFISFKNFHFKKNGPKVFLKLYDDKLITITGTGIISFISIICT